MPFMHSYIGQPFETGTRNWTFYPTVCFSFRDREDTNGIFYDENPLNFLYPVFMLQVILAFFISWLVYFALRPLRQPRFVCNILAGIILGPSVLGRNKTFLDTIFPDEGMLIFNTMVRFGILYWIFLIAVKSETTMLLRSARKFWALGIFSFILPFGITLCFSFVIENQITPCIKDLHTGFLCATLSVTYFPSVAQVLQELGLLTTEFGQLALSSSMLIEVTCVLFLYIGAILTKETFLLSLLYLFALCATIFFAIFIIRPAMVLISDKTPVDKPVQECYVVAILVMTLIMVFITDTTWIDFQSGALLMGLIVPQGSPLSATLVEKSELMVSEFFMPLFYIQIGILTDISSLFQDDIRAIYALLSLIVVSILTKFVGTFLASLYLDVTPVNAFLLGLIVNIKGVVDMTTFHRFRTNDNLDAQFYTILVFTNVVFIGIYHSLVEIFWKPKLKLVGGNSKTKCPRSLQSNLEIKELRALTCIYSEDSVHGIITLLKACNHKAITPLYAYVIHAIDLVGGTSPTLITFYRSHKRSSKQDGSATLHIMQAFEKYSKSSEGYVSILPLTMVAPVKIMHDIICNLAEERHVAFIIVPFHINQMGISNGTFRDVNVQLQMHAPCTVGILLDKGLHPQNNLEKLSCRVVVFFLGGIDDREALALAIRMSRNSNVNITLIRIRCTMDRKNMDDKDMVLDDLLVKQFKEKIENNNCAFYCEESVNNSFDMVNVVRTLRNKYDLVLVGKNSCPTQIEKEMLHWTVHSELGVIGDVLASADCSDNRMSVLVIKHYS